MSKIKGKNKAPKINSSRTFQHIYIKKYLESDLSLFFNIEKINDASYIPFLSVFVRCFNFVHTGYI